MDIENARVAGEIAKQIDALDKLIASAELAIEEGWRVTTMIATAPAEGSSLPGGTPINLLTGPELDAETSAFALQTALEKYQGMRADLAAQLEAV